MTRVDDLRPGPAPPPLPEIVAGAEAVEAAAARLRQAAETRVPCAPVRDLIPPGDLAGAYAVQDLNNRRALGSGRRAVGWKVGLTSPAVQTQLGVEQPDFGLLLSDTAVGDDLPIDATRLLQPRVEAEVAFVLEADLPASGVTAADVLRATAFVLPAIEVVDSRVAGWDITIVDTVADNASSGLFVLGGTPTPILGCDLRSVEMRLRAGGRDVAEGTGASCLAHPVNAVVWLADTLARVGQPLRAGDIVLSGALGPMVPAVAGTVYEADISSLGTVRARFAPAEDA